METMQLAKGGEDSLGEAAAPRTHPLLSGAPPTPPNSTGILGGRRPPIPTVYASRSRGT